jgi:RNA polymerase sigma-70 factor (ECF subfamily)
VSSSTDEQVCFPSADDAPARARPPSFEELYARYFDFVWRIVRRFGVHPSLVEDAAQDTFIVVHRRLTSLRPEASAKAFVFSIAVRVAHDYRRSARRKGTSSLDESDLPAQDASPHEHAERAHAGRLVHRFLATLPPDLRTVFVLAELEGMTAPEISELTAVNLSTVYTRLRAVRIRFVTFLDARESGDG